MIRKFRKGDIVTIQGTVDFHYDDNVSVIGGKISLNIEGHHSTLVLPVAQIKLHQPFFAAGDRIRKSAAKSVTGTVLASSDGYLWVRFDRSIELGTISSLAVELLPPEEEVSPHVAAA